MSKLKVSVIGTGHLGSVHLKLLKQSENVEVVGIYDASSDRANELAAEYSVTAFPTVEDAINNSDALIIAAPTVNHFEIADKCLDAGKHIFIEKPIAQTHEQGINK